MGQFGGIKLRSSSGRRDQWNDLGIDMAVGFLRTEEAIVQKNRFGLSIHTLFEFEKHGGQLSRGVSMDSSAEDTVGENVMGVVIICDFATVGCGAFIIQKRPRDQGKLHKHFVLAIDKALVPLDVVHEEANVDAFELEEEAMAVKTL